jgi:Recombination endonuclease VII
VTATPVKYGARPKVALGTPCESCGSTKTRPVADHCHAHGWVRGLICRQCNGLMGLIDQRITPQVEAVLLKALLALWHRCPDCGHLDPADLKPACTEPMTLRLQADLYETLRREAFDTRESMNSIVVAAVDRELKARKSAAKIAREVTSRAEGGNQ